MSKFFKKIINAIRRLFGWKGKQKEVEVPQGLQVWDSDGVNTLDTTTGTVKILGKFEYSADDVTINHPLLATETPFYIIHPRKSQSDNNLRVTFSGSSATIRNRWGNQAGYYTIYVGVY